MCYFDTAKKPQLIKQIIMTWFFQQTIRDMGRRILDFFQKILVRTNITESLCFYRENFFYKSLNRFVKKLRPKWYYSFNFFTNLGLHKLWHLWRLLTHFYSNSAFSWNMSASLMKKFTSICSREICSYLRIYCFQFRYS